MSPTRDDTVRNLPGHTMQVLQKRREEVSSPSSKRGRPRRWWGYSAWAILVACAFLIGVLVGKSDMTTLVAGHATKSSYSPTVDRILTTGPSVYMQLEEPYIFVATQMRSVVQEPLPVGEPLTLIHDDGTRLEDGSVLLIKGWDYEPGSKYVEATTLSPQQEVTIAFRAPFDCQNPQVLAWWRDTPPTISIPFETLDRRWLRPVTELMSPGPDQFISRVCED